MRPLFIRLKTGWVERPFFYSGVALGVALVLVLVAWLPSFFAAMRVENRVEFLESELAMYEDSMTKDSWAEGLPFSDELSGLAEKGAKQEIAELRDKLDAWDEFRRGEITADELPESERPFAS